MDKTPIKHFKSDVDTLRSSFCKATFFETKKFLASVYFFIPRNMVITIISYKSQVQWMNFIANKGSKFFIMWLYKAQTSKPISTFILNLSGNRALSKH